MRTGFVVLFALLSGAAAGQTPPAVEWEKPVELFAVPGGPLVVEDAQKLPPSGKLNVMVEGGPAGSMSVSDVLDHIRQGRRVWLLNFKSTTPTCDVDYSEIDAEKKASDERKRQMDRRGDIIPLHHQYEQEMYYEDRRNRIYEKTCGKPTRNYNADRPDMRKRACDVLGVVCKPVKHW
jgi:hypothetical protein